MGMMGGMGGSIDVSAMVKVGKRDESQQLAVPLLS